MGTKYGLLISEISFLWIHFKFKNKPNVFVSLASILSVLVVLILTLVFFSYVQLKPKIGENFFFSNSSITNMIDISNHTFILPKSQKVVNLAG